MKENFLLLSIPFTSIRISVIFIAVVFSVTVFADFSVFTVLVLLAAAFHESGHIFALYITGANISGIDILPFGAVIHSDITKLSYKKEFAVSIAGITANIICAVISFVFFLYSRDIFSLFFASCNIFLGLANLIPAGNLDGARIMETILFSHFSFDAAEKAHRYIALAMTVVLWSFAVLFWVFTHGNYSLILFCVCVLL